MKKMYFFGAVVCTLFLASCKPDSNVTPSSTNAHAVYVSCEGNYNGGNGDVSVFYPDSSRVINQLFYNANGSYAGDVVNSFTAYNGKGYIIVNNSNKIQVVNLSNFTRIATISGISQPRYFMALGNNLGVVSSWGSDGQSGALHFIDLSSNTVNNTVVTGKAPEKMIFVGSEIYVCNSGGISSDSTVAVVDINTMAVTNRIQVGNNPSGLFKDNNNNLFVLCGGKKVYDVNYNLVPALSTKGSLHLINPNTKRDSLILTVPDLATVPSRLCGYKADNVLYYLYGNQIKKFDITHGTLSNFGVTAHNWYGLGCDPNNGKLYATDPLNYATEGWLYRFGTNSSGLITTDSVRTGIIPGDISFY